MNLAENFVSEIGYKTFLSLWSFPNPLGKNSKELCDFLVICDPYIIIFSVKHIQIKESGNEEVDILRWKKRAIEDSAKQLYGAETFIRSVNKITLKDRTTEVLLPEKSQRIIFRISVSIGRGTKFPLHQENFGKGFVHVFDEKSIFTILKELDTITDFTNYLTKKEKYISSCVPIISKEEDLLGYYILNNKTFPENINVTFFEDDIWDGLNKNEYYIKRKEADVISYIWDFIIENFYNTFPVAPHSNIKNRTELESAFRIMVKEDRLSRRSLSFYFDEFINIKREDNQFAVRLIKSNSNTKVAYLFLAGAIEKREERREALELRCFVARSLHKECTTVIGIATEPYVPNTGYSFDFYSIEIQEWDDELDKEAKAIQEEYGYFKNLVYQHRQVDEYSE